MTVETEPPSSNSLTTLTSLLTSSTTPPSTLSSLFTTLSHQAYPPPLSLPLAVAIETHLPVLTTTDLVHAVTILTHLAARDDTTAAKLVSDNSAVRLIRACASIHDIVLREALRRLAVILGIRPDQFARLLHPRLMTRYYPRLASRKPLAILSIDGGGAKGLIAMQILKRIERIMGCAIRDCFDVIGGTSCGGVLAMGVGLLQKPLEEIGSMFLQFAKEVFSVNKKGVSGGGLYRAGKVLLLKRGVYNTRALWELYDQNCGNWRLYQHAAGNGTPRVFALSTQMKSTEKGVSTPRVYLHANYRVASRYTHGCLHKISDALKATTAAPIYFDPFVDETAQEVFCDGAVLVNNPAGVAVHEARKLWPGRPIGAVVSVGNGVWEGGQGEEGLVMKVAKAVLESATDTEGVHHALEDLIEEGTYFRLNPRLEQQVLLNESRKEVLEHLAHVGQKYAQSATEVEKACAKLKAIGKSRYTAWRGLSRSYARL